MNMTPLLPFVASPRTQALAVRIYARVLAQDPARMYVRGRIFCPVTVRTCTRLRRDCVNCYVGCSTTTRAASYSATVHTCRETDQPVCTYTFPTRQTTLRTL